VEAEDRAKLPQLEHIWTHSFSLIGTDFQSKVLFPIIFLQLPLMTLSDALGTEVWHRPLK